MLIQKDEKDKIVRKGKRTKESKNQEGYKEES
jgi:hypothetical protein